MVGVGLGDIVGVALRRVVGVVDGVGEDVSVTVGVEVTPIAALRDCAIATEAKPRTAIAAIRMRKIERPRTRRFLSATFSLPTLRMPAIVSAGKPTVEQTDVR